MVIPVTKIAVSPCVVTQIKTGKDDGYSAMQIGCGNKKNLSKSVQGHLKKLGNFQYLREFRINKEDEEKFKIGDGIAATVFTPGDVVKVTGVSKGKGFQGVVKRHHFHGHPKTHGHKDQLRMSGSIGATGPAHVFKGTKMGGRMGGEQVTVSNLRIIEVDADKQELFIRGAVPGSRGGLIFIVGAGEMELKPIEQEVENKSEENIVVKEGDNQPTEKIIEDVAEEKVENHDDQVKESGDEAKKQTEDNKENSEK